MSDAAIQDQVDILSDLPADIYCDLVETLNDKCLETSILEIWKYDEERISALSQEEIIEAVNVIKESPFFGHAFDYSSLLGDVTRDPTSGRIIAAKSAFHLWVTSVDPDANLKDESGTGLELDLADSTSLDWESKLIQTMLEFDHQMPQLSVLVNVARRSVQFCKKYRNSCDT